MEAGCQYLSSAHNFNELTMESVKFQKDGTRKESVSWQRQTVWGVAAAFGLSIFGLALSLAGQAMSQDATQVPLQPQSPLQPQPGTPPAQPTADPISNEQIELLLEGGLIDQQSKLSEGILLMDRQLRYLQLQRELEVAKEAVGGSVSFDMSGQSGVRQIYGQTGNLTAVISVDGQQNTVTTGDQLSNGSVVLNITPSKVELQAEDGRISELKAP
jgi:glucose/arabinose dehydrogenase